jgi:3-methyladenine DNA glycosylase AlkD
MLFAEVMDALEKMGSEQVKKIFLRHGAREPFFGVKVGDMKTIVKKVKKNHELALQLYDTGNSDAMYLAGLIADEKQMTPELLQHWAEGAYWNMISEYSVAWVAAESAHGWQLGNRWIADPRENIASSGWATLGACLAHLPDERIPHEEVKGLLTLIEKNIHTSQNRVKYTMNGFVIMVGVYMPDLKDLALDVARAIGKVDVYMGDTYCQTPVAHDYIVTSLEKRGPGKKKKTVRC